MPAFKLSLPGFALGLRRRPGPVSPRPLTVDPFAPEALPPILAIEGQPDPTIRKVVEAAAERMGAAVCFVEDASALPSDPDAAALVGVVLTRARCPRDVAKAVRELRRALGSVPVVAFSPQPILAATAAAIPVDPSFVAPPVSVDRLLFALHSREDSAPH